MSSLKEKLKLVNILAALSLEERDEVYLLVDNQVTFVAGAVANANPPVPAPIQPVTATKVTPVSTLRAALDAAPAAQPKERKKPGPKPKTTPPAPVSTASSDPVAAAMAGLDAVDLS